MPRPSPFPHHPVRVLRDYLGFTSAASFASFVGVPAETIRNVESRHPLSDRLTKRIVVATGVLSDWLRQGNSATGVPVAWDGRPLPKRQDTVGPTDPDDDDDSVDLINDACAFVTDLMRAAIR